MPRFTTVFFLWALTVTLGSVPVAKAADAPAGALDLSTPGKAFESFLDARMADDLSSVLACVTADAGKKAAIDTLMKNEVAKHQLETVAMAKFGAEASKIILDTQRPIQDELAAEKKRLIESRPDIDKDGNSAVLYLRAERNPPDGVEPYNEGIHFLKVNGQWKIDGVKYLHQEDQGDPDLAQTQLLGVSLAAAMTEYMNTLTAGIKKGSFRSAEQARASLDAKLNSFADSVPTGTTTSAPAPEPEPKPNP